MTVIDAILIWGGLCAILAIAIGIRLFNGRADERAVRRMIARRGEVMSVRPEMEIMDGLAGAPDTVSRYRVHYRTPQGEKRQAVVLLTFLRHKILSDEPVDD